MIKLTNIGRLITFKTETQKVENRSGMEILVDGEKIVAIDKNVGSADETYNCNGKLVTPGFVDPHTHPVFYDGREEEYARRLAGATYQEIAAKGGGIRSSIMGVREATEDELFTNVRKSMNRFLKLGTTTVEAKSGYGLDTESELKSLRVLDRINREHCIDIIPTFLGAHAFPPEYSDNHDGYVSLLCEEMIPAVANQGIAIFCDVFCENGYFNVNQSRRILETAKSHGLISRLHADEFEDSGAAELAAEMGAVSADHLMAASDTGIRSMAEAGVTAILLPGTTFFLGSTAYAPAKKFIDAGVEIALATDFNPGSSHLQSMPFIISLACLYLGLSVEDAFRAATWQSAVTLGIQERVGSLEKGKQADIIIWNIDKLIEIPYFCTDLPIRRIMKSGEWWVENGEW